ncbi:hypothetical protein OAS30_00940 [Candidatus Pelagibacter sp.]|nr:hypothetical protein [Candidatus Pelagibacter sp.]
MEVLRMDYRFTAILIIMLTLLALFGGPAHSKNEYLNEYGVRCGEMEISTEQRDTDYNYSDSSTNEQQYLRFTYRKYLGTDCKTSKENVQIKQQLELMKMCGRVNSNPSLAQNENFRLLVTKCRGVTPARDNTRPENAKSLWDDMKDEYKKENPEVNLMGDKFIKSKKTKLDKRGLKMPPKEVMILPLPKPTTGVDNEEWNKIK